MPCADRARRLAGEDPEMKERIPGSNLPPCVCCDRKVKVLHTCIDVGAPYVPVCLRCLRIADILGQWAKGVRRMGK